FEPRLELRLPESRQIDGLQFLSDRSLAASSAKEVAIAFDGGRATPHQVDEEGYVRFTPRTAQRIVIEFGATRPLVTINSRSGHRTFAPVGASEIRVLGAEDLIHDVPSTLDTGAPCGFGPGIILN